MKKTCKTCPWVKGNQKPGLIGGSLPSVYIGQILGPFYLPCHSSQDYAGKQTDLTDKKTKQCAGAAIFRSNIDVAKLMPEGISILPEDKENVFASKEEFLAYYYNVPEELVKAVFTEQMYKELLLRELNDSQVKYYNTKTLEKL